MALTGCATAGTSGPGASNPSTPGSPDVISGTGTVKFIDLEGGFYGIMGDDSKNYDPINNLGQEFEKDGLRVNFEAKIRTDIATTRMWGTPVEIIKIELCKT